MSNEAFEAWAKNQAKFYSLEKYPKGTYKYANTNNAFAGYLIGRNTTFDEVVDYLERQILGAPSDQADMVHNESIRDVVLDIKRLSNEGTPYGPGNRPTLAVAHGSDEHLTLLGALQHLNLLTGQDRADMLAFGRECLKAGRKAALTEAEKACDAVCGNSAPGFSDRYNQAAIVCISEIRRLRDE